MEALLTAISSPAFNGGAVANPVLVPDGTVSLPGLAFSSDPDNGFYFDPAGTDAIGITLGGIWRGSWSTGGVKVRSNGTLGWGGGDANDNTTAELNSDGDDIIAFRRSSQNCEFRIYSEYTDSDNYSRMSLRAADGDYNIDMGAAGTGTLRGLNIAAAADSLCFYGGTPVALQTGVAATEAGIHAALVALNLITA